MLGARRQDCVYGQEPGENQDTRGAGAGEG